jgi:hypothetical protein
MLYAVVNLGPQGVALVLEAAKRERAYRLVCLAALKKGQPLPPADDLPSIVASYVRYWAVQTYGREESVSSGDVPVYHVPPRGWTLIQNGVTFVVLPRQITGITRVAAVFEKNPTPGKIDMKSMLVVSKQANGWLATFKECNG